MKLSTTPRSVLAKPTTFCVGLLLLCFATACIKGERKGGRLHALRTELGQQQFKWAAAGITDYLMVETISCNCVLELPRTVRMHVDGNLIVSMEDDENGDPVDPQFVAAFHTVDGLFDLIQDAIDRKASSIQVSYDAQLGFPSTLFIDYFQEIADDEIGFTASQLQGLRREGALTETTVVHTDGAERLEVRTLSKNSSTRQR